MIDSLYSTWSVLKICQAILLNFLHLRTSSLGRFGLGTRNLIPQKNLKLLRSCTPHHRKVDMFYQGILEMKRLNTRMPCNRVQVTRVQLWSTYFWSKLFVSGFYWKTIENISVVHAVVHPFDSERSFEQIKMKPPSTHIGFWYLLPHPRVCWNHEILLWKSMKIKTVSFHYHYSNKYIYIYPFEIKGCSYFTLPETNIAPENRPSQ